MKTIFDVDEKEVSLLDPVGFADFINHLLRAEASRIGLPSADLHTSLRVSTPDGGVDARVERNTQQSDWIPIGTSIWQFKSGKDHDQAKLRKEFSKPGVQEVLQAGGSYRVVVCDDLGNNQLQDRVKVLAECCRNAGIPPDRARIYAADKIAAWARRHFAMRLLLGSPSIGNLFRWETWNALPQFGQPFAADSQRQDILDAIRRGIEDPSGPLSFRIMGRAGVGKSRLVLEALRSQNGGNGLAERSLYADNPLAIPDGLFHWLELNHDTNLVLVVDECERVDVERLERQAQRCNGRLRLLTIDQTQDALSGDRPNTYYLSTLNDAVMRGLLVTAVDNLPDAAYDFAVRFASGFVKLAVNLAEAMRDYPDRISWHGLAEVGIVKDVIEKFLIDDRTDRQVMRALALLRRVGWDGDAEGDGRIVIDFLNLDWYEARDRVQELMRRGLIAKQGRYRYVTPHLLAVWLAAQVWENYGDRPLDLLMKLPSQTGRQAFLQRLRDLGDDQRTTLVCEKMLASNGMFRDLETLNDDWHSQFFSSLATAHPKAGLRALRRLLSEKKPDDLRAFKLGRRNIVSVLQSLAWFPDTFADAARLLLMLAEAENENWANNAEGAWVDLFGTFLGATAADAQQRYELITEALDGPSVERQLLGVRAISRAFVLQESSFVFGDAESGRIPPERWNPPTWNDSRTVRLGALRLLDRALNAEEPSVCAEARKVLLEQATELALVGLADELVDRMETFPQSDYDQRRKIRDAAEGVLMLEQSQLSAKQRRRLSALSEQLAGSSFGDRLRRWVGEHIMADWHLERQDLHDSSGREAADLAEEAFISPDLLRPELDWLTSTQALHVYYFAQRLGQLDADHEWWAEIEPRVRDGKGYTMASAYLQGHCDKDRRSWRDDVLERWSEEAELAPAVLDAVFRSEPPSDADADRLFRLMDRGWLTASQVSVLTWGGQTSPFSLDGFRRIISGVLQEDAEGTTASALGLLFSRLNLCPADKDALEPYVWQALERPDALSGRQFHAIELAQKYMGSDPIRVVRLVVRNIERGAGSLMRSSGTVRLLEQATRLCPKEAWTEVSQILWPLRQESYAFYHSLKGWYGQVVGAEVLLPWASQHLPQGPWLAASLVQVGGQPMNDLVREFLIQYQNEESVGNALSAEFGSGSWEGPISSWYQVHVDAARQWMNDSHPAVRTWAAREVEVYEVRLAEALLQEEEGYI